MRGLKRLFYSLAQATQPRDAAVVLAYHSISNAQHWSAVSPEQFEAHIRALKDGGFNVVSLDRLLEYRKAGTIPPKTVCITFDDGYRDNYTTAFPILKEYGFPATIFVITSAIGGTWTVRSETFDMLSEPELKELASSGLVSIEPHTVSHPKLHSIGTEEAQREIRDSKLRLESITGASCRHFAYPFGRMNEGVREAARRAGIEYAYTIDPGFVRPRDNDLMLRRNAIDRMTDVAEFLGIARAGRLSRKRLFSS
jgi:peptidoglycan/xylan/chitin deacetylase (PgdA/CDA1 family)